MVEAVVLALAQDDALIKAVDAAVPELVDQYVWFHQNPELSLQEVKTAERFAVLVRKQGWEVEEKIGGTGVVAVLKNGAGPCVLARIDMDALPVQEETSLAYASRNSGVMHACGHDTHLAIGVGLAKVLAAARSRWSGTAVLVGQPAEELGLGAKNMLQDPKFHALVPKPVACLSVHDFTNPAGTICLCRGWASANTDSVDLTIFGRGGHGAWPHETVDPIVMAAEMIQAFQTIHSRKIDPLTRAVITVGSIHGGTKHNVIPDQVKLQLTVRSYEDSTRQVLLGEIEHIAKKIAEANRAPKAPEMRVDPDYTPAAYNTPELIDRLRPALARLLGESNVIGGDPVMGGEDFMRFQVHYGVPGLQIRVGAVKGPSAVGLHSSRWAPDPAPTLRAGTLALAAACMELLDKR